MSADQYSEAMFEYFTDADAPKIDDAYLDEAPFNFGSISYSQYIRFLELLPPVSSFLFMKTSKSNYCKTLELRGMACRNLMSRFVIIATVFDFLKKPCIAGVDRKWMPYLAASQGMGIDQSFLPSLFTKTFRGLNFMTQDGSPEVLIGHLRQLVHPGLEEIQITIFSVIRGTPFTPNHISAFFDMLRTCTKLKLCEFNHELFLGQGNTSMTHWKEHSEAFSRQSQNLETFHFRFHRKFFGIINNVLQDYRDHDVGWTSEYNPETVMTDRY